MDNIDEFLQRISRGEDTLPSDIELPKEETKGFKGYIKNIVKEVIDYDNALKAANALPLTTSTPPMPPVKPPRKESNMKIYSIDVKEYNGCNSTYREYSRFIVLGESINDMLENLYKELFPNGEEIPYYLRSSNFVITCLGNFQPNEKQTLKEKILCKRYENWFE